MTVETPALLETIPMLTPGVSPREKWQPKCRISTDKSALRPGNIPELHLKFTVHEESPESIFFARWSLT